MVYDKLKGHGPPISSASANDEVRPEARLKEDLKAVQRVGDDARDGYRKRV